MGYSASPALLKAYVAWLKSGLLLRLLGVPAALLAVYLEVYGSSPKTTSLLLHRLSRRLRRSAVICMLGKDHDNILSPIFVGRPDAMPTGAQSSSRTSNLTTLDNHDRIASGGSDSGSAPRKQHHQRPSVSGASDASSSFSSANTLSHNPPLASPSSPSHRFTMHSRSQSSADVMRSGKRLSLQFPIQPSTGSNSPMFSPRSRPQSWVAAPSPLLSPEAPSAPETNLLAVVAAQERYVLELKEELAKAEQDLKMLKKHFATQEAMKQRHELRNVTQLQPLNTHLANFGPDQDDQEGSNLSMQKEMERRKALLTNIKSSQRKVFSGSRHLRTLSLLSPDKAYAPSFPQPSDLHREPSTASLATSTKFNNHLRPAPIMRNSTSPIIADHIADTVNTERYDAGGLPNVQRDALIRTGKQMATDFKDGLLTFIEDIRQATVGEEPIGAEHSGFAAKGRKPSDARPVLQRASSSKKSSSSASKTGGIGDDFWKEHGLSEPKASPACKKTHAPKHHTAHTPQKTANAEKMSEEFEDWDNWDTPAPNDKHGGEEEDNSSDDSDSPSSPVSHQASSRTSTRYHAQRHDSKASTLTQSSSWGFFDDALPRDPKRNSIPWPDLVKYSPNNLKRTASHLMKEWEKNLTPPPESRGQGHPSADYIGRAISPTAGSS